MTRPTPPPILVINSDAGPVDDSTETEAVRNMLRFVADVHDRRGVLFLADRVPDNDYDGRFRFRLFLPGSDEEHLVDMPGLPLDQVRWMGPESGNIWHFPHRLYVDGSSWVWKHAVWALEDEE